MPKPYTVSPSQLTRFDSCPRNWGLNKLAGIPDPAGPGAKLGSEVHHILEGWLGESKVPPKTKAGKIAKALIPELPAPKDALEVERNYYLERPGVTFHGRIDLLYRDERGFVVHDHKTTASLRYAKTAEDLLTDWQAVQYAAAAFDAFPLREVNLEWGYVTTKGPPQTHIVHAKMDKAAVARAMAPQIKLGQKLTVLKSADADPYDLPVNMYHCDAFGGCPYYGKECNPQQQQGTNDMNQLIARMKARNEEKKVNPPAKPKAEAKPKVDLKTKPKAATAATTQDAPHVPFAEPVLSSNMTLRDHIVVAILNGMATGLQPSQLAGVDWVATSKNLYALAEIVEASRT